jgi:hypothetical protein
VIGLAVIVCLIGTMLYPLFVVRAGSYPRALVLNAEGQHIAGATLRFRDSTGRKVYEDTTGPYGTFSARQLRALSKHKVDGYAFARYLHSTGSGGWYVYSPAVSQTAQLRLANGTPIPDLPVAVFADSRTLRGPEWSRPRTAVTDRAGQLRFHPLPACAKLQFVSQDARWKVASAKRSAVGAAVHYDVTLAAATRRKQGGPPGI